MLATFDRFCFYLVYGSDAARGIVASLMVLATLLGSGWSMLALVPLFVSPKTRPFAASLAGVLMTTATLVFLLKAAVQRPRPCMALAGVRALVGAPSDYSFPSGHAAGSFAFALFVATLVRATGTRRAGWACAAGAALVSVAGCVALSRVYLGVHFPTDVLAGAALGGLVGVVGAKAYMGRRPAAEDLGRAAPFRPPQATLSALEHRTRSARDTSSKDTV